MPLNGHYTWSNGDVISSLKLNRIERSSPNLVWILIVAGGGGSQNASAAYERTPGGGAGGVIIRPWIMSASDAWTVTVGGGGAVNANGVNSSISNVSYGTITATGGGKAGPVVAGSNGGSGGGGWGIYRGGSGTDGEGSHGGHGIDLYSSPSIVVCGAGGGAGSNGDSAWVSYQNFNKQNEADWSIANGGSGIRFLGFHYGGGGANGAVGARGGQGGGGNGPAASPGVGGNGVANTGGGGGGANSNGTSQAGGQGGGGIVIFAYYGDAGSADQRATGGTINLARADGFITHTFTGSGTFTYTG